MSKFEEMIKRASQGFPYTSTELELIAEVERLAAERDLAVQGGLQIMAGRDRLRGEIRALREALNFACKSLCQVTSSDGSGHADIALSVLRLAGVDADERGALVEGWKANVKWRIDAEMQEAAK